MPTETHDVAGVVLEDYLNYEFAMLKKHLLSIESTARCRIAEMRRMCVELQQQNSSLQATINRMTDEKEDGNV